jgi:transposase
MAKAYSNDLRERIMRFYENHADYTQQELADEFAVSQSFIEKLLRRWRTTGSSAVLPAGGGQVSPLRQHDATLEQLVAAQPDATLAELQARLATKTKLQVSVPTVCRALQRLRLRRKKSPGSPANSSVRRS